MMIISITYYLILAALSLTGYALLKENRLGQLAIEKSRQLKKRISEGLDTEGQRANVFAETAFSLSKSNYELFRCILLFTGFAAGLILKNNLIMILSIVAFVSAAPITEVGSFTTPFGHFRRVLRIHYMDKKDSEIYEAMAFLKNNIVISKNNPVGADFIIEQLAGYGDLLKPIYFKMLNLLRLNRKEEAIDFFAREAGTRMSKDFGRLLIQLDEISPRELEETLISYQKNMREVRITRQKQQDEIISDLLYLPVVVNVLLIFVNFIYVSYFIEQKDMFGVLVN